MLFSAGTLQRLPVRLIMVIALSTVQLGCFQEPVKVPACQIKPDFIAACYFHILRLWFITYSVVHGMLFQEKGWIKSVKANEMKVVYGQCRFGMNMNDAHYSSSEHSLWFITIQCLESFLRWTIWGIIPLPGDHEKDHDKDDTASGKVDDSSE